LSIPVGPPSVRTVANGSGFGISEIVDISFDDRQIARATTDGSGSFSRKIRVPGQAVPGDHTVGAIGESSGSSAETVFTVRTDWPMERFDQRGSGFNSLENVISPLTVTGLRVRWKVQFDDYCSSSICTPPVVANGLVYAADSQGVLALDASTGATVWVTNLSRDLVGVTATKTAVVTSSTGSHPTVYALDAITGDVLWSTVIDGVGREFTPAVVAAGIVFVGTQSGSTLVALDAATGTEVWRMTGDGRFSAPAISGGVAYTHSGGTLFALDAATGAVIWQVDASEAGPLEEVTTVADGRVFALTFGGDLQAFDAGTGALDWTVHVGQYPRPAVAVANGVVFAVIDAIGDASVAAIDAATGAVLWSSSTLGEFIFNASPTVANGLVFIGTEPNGIHACGVCALDARTGEEVWDSYGGAQDPDYGSAFAVNGMVYSIYYEIGGDATPPKIVAFWLP
jgi:outer membrane protein assembly factor BamB